MGNKKIQTFTDLIAWKEGHRLVVDIYKVTKSFPNNEIYGMVSQMRRAAVSITSNIAEGFGRKGYKEKLQFYYMASGSLTELKNQILISKDIDYLVIDDYRRLVEEANSAHKLLNLLISKTKTFLKS